MLTCCCVLLVTIGLSKFLVSQITIAGSASENPQILYSDQGSTHSPYVALVNVCFTAFKPLLRVSNILTAFTLRPVTRRFAWLGTHARLQQWSPFEVSLRGWLSCRPWLKSQITTPCSDLVNIYWDLQLKGFVVL